MAEEKQLTLPVLGMTCANCVAAVERNAKKVDGVTNATVNYASEKVTVTFSKSKKTLEWDSSSNSLLDFAHQNGVSIEANCRSGNCGSCITALKKGGVVYLRAPGRETADGACLTCIAVPRENLTLQA